MSEFQKMTEDEFKVVNMIYVELLGLFSRFSLEVNTQHSLTSMTMMMIAQGIAAGLSKEFLADQFIKIGEAINDGDYDDFIHETMLINKKPPTDVAN